MAPLTNYFLEMVLEGLPPTTNAMMGFGLRKRMRVKKEWRDRTAWMAKAKRPPAPLKYADLICVRYSSVEPDSDGLVSSFKHLIDGLVLGGVLENDKYGNIGMPTYAWVRTKPKEGRVTITVKENYLKGLP